MPLRRIRTVLLIAGMRDNRCREHVAHALERVEGVQQVSVDLFRARSVILHEPPCSARDLIRAVAVAGYVVLWPTHRPNHGVRRAPPDGG